MIGSVIGDEDLSKLYPNGEHVNEYYDVQSNPDKKFLDSNMPSNMQYNNTEITNDNYGAEFNSNTIFKTPQGNFQIEV